MLKGLNEVINLIHLETSHIVIHQLMLVIVTVIIIICWRVTDAIETLQRKVSLVYQQLLNLEKLKKLPFLLTIVILAFSMVKIQF